MKRVAAIATLATMGLALYAWLIAQFVPSPVAVALGYGGAVACALGGGIFTMRTPLKPDSPARKSVMRHTWVRVPLAALFCGMVGFSAWAIGFPALYTVSAGTSANEPATVASWYDRSRRECRGFSIQGEPFLAPRLCYSGHELKRGTPIRLYGNESPLGLVVGGIAVPSGGG